MAILELPKSGTPLSQGDILKGVTLFVTDGGWNDKGGDHLKAPFEMCLVVSRPCAIAHRKQIIVAGIDKYPDKVPKDMNTFDEVLDFLIGMRDGRRAPDSFYLGHLPSEKGRFRARLDSMHTIRIPSDQTAMDEFLKVKRVASLHMDFARDLHLRIFNAFASLGFEDHSWPSDEDLKWLVDVGNSDLAQAELTASQQRAKKSSQDAQGKQFEEKALANAETKLDELRKKVAPFETEMKRRQSK